MDGSRPPIRATGPTDSEDHELSALRTPATRCRTVLALSALVLAACGGGKSPKSTARPLTLDEASIMADIQYADYQDEGATFRVATSFRVSNDVLQLEGEIDWKNHVGHAVVASKGSADGITEVYWTPQYVLERRPGADAVLIGLGLSGVKYFVRTPEPAKRLLDRSLAVIVGLASTQRDNPQLIQQAPESAFLRSDTLRGSKVSVLRYGARSIYWVDSGTNKLLRFEGNASAGAAPIIVDIMSRGRQTITLPARNEVVPVESVRNLYDAIDKAGGTPEPSSTGPGS